VDDGNTVTDWMEQERERGITITSAAVTCFWTQKKKRAWSNPLRVCRIASTSLTRPATWISPPKLNAPCAFWTARSPCSAVSRAFSRNPNGLASGDKYNVPRIAFVNKMDRTGANFENALKDMRKKLGAYAYPIFLPIGAEDKFEGVIDVVNQKAITWGVGEVVNEGLKYEVKEIPERLKKKAKTALAELIDAVSNKDDAIAELVIGEKPVEPLVLKAAIRRLTCKIELIPVLCGSAFKKKGVQPLIDAIVDYLPGPLDVPGAQGVEVATDKVVHIETSDSNKFCSLAFKLWTDVYAGKLVFFRVYSGQLKKGDTIYNPRTRKRDRVSRLMIIQGSERKDIDRVYAGDIAALSVCGTSLPATRCPTKTTM